MSAAYTLPDSMFADVIEWDELRTRRRQEGIFYGIRTLIRKMTGALVIFTTLQLLGWSGYVSPPDGALQFTQTDSALRMIRLLVSPFGAIILCGTILLAWLFPLSREVCKDLKVTRTKKNAPGRSKVDYLIVHHRIGITPHKVTSKIARINHISHCAGAFLSSTASAGFRGS